MLHRPRSIHEHRVIVHYCVRLVVVEVNGKTAGWSLAEVTGSGCKAGRRLRAVTSASPKQIDFGGCVKASEVASAPQKLPSASLEMGNSLTSLLTPVQVRSSSCCSLVDSTRHHPHRERTDTKPPTPTPPRPPTIDAEQMLPQMALIGTSAGKGQRSSSRGKSGRLWPTGRRVN